MTADLVARLRGIIAAKPPHVTVLADNEEVYPIRVEVLREAADALEAAEVVVDLWGPVERGQSEFTDALSSLRETLDRSQDQHSDNREGER